MTKHVTASVLNSIKEMLSRPTFRKTRELVRVFAEVVYPISTFANQKLSGTKIAVINKTYSYGGDYANL